jgi:hypothetical protein
MSVAASLVTQHCPADRGMHDDPRQTVGLSCSSVHPSARHCVGCAARWRASRIDRDPQRRTAPGAPPDNGNF